MDEQALLAAARQLDETALATIFDTYYTPLYRYIYHHVGHVQTAEDLTSLVFQRLLHHLHGGMGPDRHLKAWLFRVAYTVIVDDSRRQQHRNHRQLDQQPLPDDTDIEHQTDRRLLAHHAHAALTTLTDNQRNVIILRYLVDMQPVEIAQILEMTVGAVKALQQRALAALRRELKPYMAHEGHES